MGARIHCIGIGGIGISALARHYLHEGWEVSGSDLVETENSKKLEADGITVVYEQSPKNIVEFTSKGCYPLLVVYSDGVTKETAGWGELEAARAAGIETISYFEALARIANQYYLIAVAGTHGKTTVTAMLADVLEEASFDPTIFVGSLRTKTGTNYRHGTSKYCVVEADEYLRHFLYFTPDVLVINNIDLDHPDYFTDLTDVQRAFTELVAKVPEGGFIIADRKHPHVAPVLAAAKATVVDYSDTLNLTRVMQQPGLHNRQNAAAAEVVARSIGVEQKHIDRALEHFLGTARRFEYKGTVQARVGQTSAGGALVYDDYAHNPQKVAAAIAGAREQYPTKQLVAVFQAHTYSRTKALFNEFVDALATADRVVLLPIFAAREIDDGSVSSEMLGDALMERGVAIEHYQTIEAAVLAVRESTSSSDVVLCVGAGSVTKVATQLTAER